jgi:xylose isomerase
MPNAYDPRPDHKFSFGLWTVSNRGRDPFGDVVRPALAPVDAVRMLGEVGAWGVNFHDNDLVPIDATPSERDKIVKDFKAACNEHNIVVPMATVNLFFDPVFRDGAFTANDPQVRPTPCKRRFGRWISEPSSGRRSSCCGADGKAPRRTRAGGPMKP